MTETLLGLPLWQDRLSQLTGSQLDGVTRQRLCVFATLHDVGKFNIGFQAKGRPELGPTAGHVSEALAAIGRPGPMSPLYELGAWGDAAFDLLVAAICHHGRPVTIDAARASWQTCWWAPRGGLNPQQGIGELVDSCRAWFPEAFDTAAVLPEAASLTHAFAGLVMLADWLASDPKLFPFSPRGEGDRMPVARAIAQERLRDLALEMALDLRKDVEARDSFRRVADGAFDPRPAQRATLELPLDDCGSITVLEAETGSGKTEAALSRFVTLFEAGLVDGLYFALPTRTAATQLYRRVCKAVRQAFVDPPPVVLAVPGYLSVDDQVGRRLAPFEVQWPDQDRFRHRGWAAENSKRFLAASIAVGTIDQVLLSTLRVGHAHLRAVSLLRQLLVVDEVHASDAYMERLLRHVLARHFAAGGHALLLSATLGAEARERLLHPLQSVAAPTIEEAESLPYPSLARRARTKVFEGIESPTLQREIEVSAMPWMGDTVCLALEAWEQAVRGAKVLVLRNTVTDCVTTQQAIEEHASQDERRDLLFSCCGVAAPHHARFARIDREALDAALEERLGKSRSSGGCVVVATQTVQQSLDIDADILLTDLCPADVLLQRIGRVHRHERERPPGFSRPRVVVLVPAERDLSRWIHQSGNACGPHGIGTVYEDLRILEATWRLLTAHSAWRIPSMNRYLVERSLHSTVLEGIARELEGAWLDHSMTMIGNARGGTKVADLNTVDWSTPYASEGFPDAADGRIATRLGEGDRRAIFPFGIHGPFGLPLHELTIPARWTNGLSEQSGEAREVSTKDGTVAFKLGELAFLYTRLGLRPAAS